jgi:hypothetical protein
MKTKKKDLFSTLKSSNKTLALTKEDMEALTLSVRNGTAAKSRSKEEIVKLLIGLGKHLKQGGTIKSYAESKSIHVRCLREYRYQFEKNPEKYLGRMK